MTTSLEFSGTLPRGPVISANNRDWSTTEEADICCYKAEVIVQCHDDWAVLSKTGLMDDPYLVQIFAVADNVYIAHQAYAATIYVTNSLHDCLEFAANAVITS